MTIPPFLFVDDDDNACVSITVIYMEGAVWTRILRFRGVMRDINVEGKGVKLEAHGRAVQFYFIAGLEHSTYWYHTTCKASPTTTLAGENTTKCYFNKCPWPFLLPP